MSDSSTDAKEDTSIRLNHGILFRGSVLFTVSAASMYWWHKFDSKRARTVAALTGLFGAYHVYRGVIPNADYGLKIGVVSGVRKFIITDLNKVFLEDLRKMNAAIEGKSSRGWLPMASQPDSWSRKVGIKSDDESKFGMPDDPLELQKLLEEQQLRERVCSTERKTDETSPSKKDDKEPKERCTLRL